MTIARNFNHAIGSGIVVAALLICASAFADTTKDRTVAAKNHRVVRKVTQKPCHVSFGSSAIPEPCDRVGEFPSTASPMHIIGGSPVAQKTR